jgi:hypothetical protein
MVTNGWKVTISGSTAAQYDGTFKVTRVVDANNFDMKKVFGTDPGNGSFLVEYIYKCNPQMLSTLGLIDSKTGGTMNAYICLQELDELDLQNADVLWFKKTISTPYSEGDDSTIHGFKITGNPTGGAVQYVITQTRR